MSGAPEPSPLPLSVAIVCCDNETTIGRTLASVHGLAAEIVAVDSGSTDGTIGLCEAAGARVVHQPFLGYVRQKQFALEQCTQPWLLHLDSDESVEPDLHDAIERAVSAGAGGPAGYEVRRRVWYAGAMLRHAWQPEWRLRLVRRAEARWTGIDPHDRLELLPGASGPVARLDGTLRHDAIPSMAAFLARQASHAAIGARGQFDAGKRTSVARLALSPVGAWLRQMLRSQAWRDGWRGWAAASSTAAATLMKHAILLELQRGAGDAAREERT